MREPPHPPPIGRTGGHDPLDVLAAVRRMESELADQRARGAAALDLHDLRRLIAEDAARERRQVVDDMAVIVDLIGASWRRTAEDLARLTAEIADLRRIADDARRALGGARIEVRIDTGEDPGPGRPAPASAEHDANGGVLGRAMGALGAPSPRTGGGWRPPADPRDPAE
ncbi:MAG: hypothetical protein MUE51_15690 [Thermoleophilia bacterium]|nr:hypothetical protein [Thermoleophilia bacterium]